MSRKPVQAAVYTLGGLRLGEIVECAGEGRGNWFRIVQFRLPGGACLEPYRLLPGTVATGGWESIRKLTKLPDTPENDPHFTTAGQQLMLTVLPALRLALDSATEPLKPGEAPDAAIFRAGDFVTALVSSETGSRGLRARQEAAATGKRRKRRAR